MLNLCVQADGGGGRQSGQAMLEYVMVFVALLGLVAVLSLFLYAVKIQSNRTMDLVASEYP
ncbi:MAG: hypothetical protein PHU80_03200 [Kiritimatiellae bacterium]|nr:hypothetical protein [Kiritimatiellia bacterium]